MGIAGPNQPHWIVRGDDRQFLAGDRAAVDVATPWPALVCVSLLALALRAFHLNDGLWYDEIRSLQESVRSPLAQIATVFPGDNQHTFFSMLAHLSIGLFGEQPWSLRLPSMLLGTATVPLLYLFAREFTGRTEAVLASLLLAVSYHHVWFSQNARGYATLCFLTVLSSWLLLRGLRRDRAGDFVAYAVVAALGVYTHATMSLLVVSHALLCPLRLGWSRRDGAGWAQWRLPVLGFALAAALSLLLCAPILLALGQHVAVEPPPIAGATPRWALGELLRGMEIGFGSVLGLAAGLLLLAAGAWSYWKQSPFLLGIFLLPGVLTGAAAVLLHRPVRPRFGLFLIGFGVLVLIRGAMELGRMGSRFWAPEPRAGGRPAVAARIGTALALVLIVASAMSLPALYRHPKQDFAGALAFVDSQRADGEPVVTADGATYPYMTYYQRPWPAIRTLEELRRAQAGVARIWVVYTFPGRIRYQAPQLLDAVSRECDALRVFPGTLGDGEIAVCALRGQAAPQ